MRVNYDHRDNDHHHHHCLEGGETAEFADTRRPGKVIVHSKTVLVTKWSPHKFIRNWQFLSPLFLILPDSWCMTVTQGLPGMSDRRNYTLGIPGAAPPTLVARLFWPRSSFLLLCMFEASIGWSNAGHFILLIIERHHHYQKIQLLFLFIWKLHHLSISELQILQSTLINSHSQPDILHFWRDQFLCLN